MINVNENFLRFIEENAHEDVNRLRMRFHGQKFDFDYELALTQIECRRKNKSKLPLFSGNQLMLFPSVTAYEQSSHHAVSAYNASLAKGAVSALDMTAGLGSDAIALSEVCYDVTGCECDTLKADILEYNRSLLKIGNLRVVNCDSTAYLRDAEDEFDVIFIDPARRGENNSRVYNLKDCQPDVTGLLPLLLSRTGKIIVKASPLLDVTQTRRDLPGLSEVHAVSVNGDCKELLLVIGKEADMLDEVAVNLDNSGKIIGLFRFRNEDVKDDSAIRYAEMADLHTGAYLYEPDSSVMKLSPWQELSCEFVSLRKLGKSSHLFVGDILHKDFPGRITKIHSLPGKRELKALKGERMNVVSRNHPLKPDEIRGKYSLKEGFEKFLYATRINDKPIIIVSYA